MIFAFVGPVVEAERRVGVDFNEGEIVLGWKGDVLNDDVKTGDSETDGLADINDLVNEFTVEFINIYGFDPTAGLKISDRNGSERLIERGDRIERQSLVVKIPVEGVGVFYGILEVIIPGFVKVGNGVVMSRQ